MLKCRVYVRIFEANQLTGEISPVRENLIIILMPTAMTTWADEEPGGRKIWVIFL